MFSKEFPPCSLSSDSDAKRIITGRVYFYQLISLSFSLCAGLLPLDPGPLQKPAVGEFRPFRECPFFIYTPISKKKEEKKVEKDIYHKYIYRIAHSILFNFILSGCCRVILAVGFHFSCLFSIISFCSLFERK